MAEMWLDFWVLWMCLYFCTLWRSYVCATPCELIWTLTWCSSWFQMHSAGCVWWKCDLWSTSTLFPLLQVLLVCLLICACSCGAYVKHRKSNRYNPFVEKIWVAGCRGSICFSFYLQWWQQWLCPYWAVCIQCRIQLWWRERTST